MKTALTHPSLPPGWTRLDVLAVILMCGIWLVCWLPLLAAPGQGSKLAGCANNLRVLGEGMRLWGNDHGDRNPNWTPWSEGGTLPDGSGPYGFGPKPGAAWFEWSVLSNEVADPRFLVCPADTAKRVASRWLPFTDTDSFVNANHRDNALSYVLGTDAFEWVPKALLSGDRHMTYDAFAGTCAARLNNVNVVWSGLSQTGWFQWTNNIHGPVGNVLLQDGSVERHSAATLRSVLNPEQNDNGTMHILPPR